MDMRPALYADARDGETGEVLMRGNNVMLGYYRNRTTAEAFEGAGSTRETWPWCIRWLHRIARPHIDSGGENISSIEVKGAAITPPWLKWLLSR
jgi:fatty-acyl-CoA synthase